MTHAPAAWVAAWLGALLGAAALAGCEREMQDMYRQPRYEKDAPSPLFADGRAVRPPPPGSVAMAAGDIAWTSSGRRGAGLVAARAAAEAASTPPAATRALLERGRERFGIFCAPCHGEGGAGDGPVVRHGFPAPPSYHQARLREVPDRHLYDVVSHGWGLMRPYGDRVPPEDRWAIVAYLRVLQWSRAAPLADLPPALQARLGGPGGERAR